MKLAKLFIAILACTSFLFAQAEGSKAEEKGETATQEKAEMKASAKMISGTLMSVDTMANTIMVKVKKTDDEFSVETGAKIMMGKKTIPLSELKTNAMIMVHYKMMDGKKVAVKLMQKANAESKMK
jgi:hypothetical protein